MLRFDHVVIAVRDLEAASAHFRDELGFDVRPGGRHVGFGTRNAIIRFGLDYLELITVEDEREARQTSRGVLVDYLREHGMGLCAYALATDDIDALATTALLAGIEMVGPFPMQRRRPDGSLLSWRLLVPGGDPYFQPWPFFIQWDMPDADRIQLETPGQHPNGATGVASLEIGAHDAQSLRDWCATLGLSALVGTDGPVQITSIGQDLVQGPRDVRISVAADVPLPHPLSAPAVPLTFH